MFSPKLQAFSEPKIFSGKKHGPTVAIIGITHGNEPVGLSIFEELIKQKILDSLESGRVMLICGNVAANEQFLLQDDPLKCRFIHHDLNRIWKSEFLPGSAEYQRREEMKMYLHDADIVMDIHSVSQGEDVLGIAGNLGLETAQKCMDVEKILIESQNAGSLRAWCEGNGKQAFGIESGNHTSESGYMNGYRNILNLLGYFGVIDNKPAYSFPKAECLDFVCELNASGQKFQYARNFSNWERIQREEIYGFDSGGEPLRHYFDGDIRIGLVQKQIQLGRGAGFLFRKREEDLSKLLSCNFIKLG